MGGKLEGGNSGIFVKNVIADSPAGRAAGNLTTGDRILEVAGVPLTSSDQTVAVEAIKNSGNPIKFVVQSLQPAPASTSKVSLEILFKLVHDALFFVVEYALVLISHLDNSALFPFLCL